MVADVSMAPEATSAISVSLSEGIDTRVQKRNPFKELKLNGFGEDAEDTKPRNCAKDGPLTQWEEFEMSLPDSDRNEMTPLIDDLIDGLTYDFMGNSGNDAFLGPLWSMIGSSSNSATRQTSSGPCRGSQPMQTKKAWGEKAYQQPPSSDQEVFIKASYAAHHQNPTQGRINLSTMIAEKSSLKRELRSIDLEFEAREGRKPTKAEKEHLRPLYVRYWKLKHQIGKLQGGAGNTKVAAVH